MALRAWVDLEIQKCMLGDVARLQAGRGRLPARWHPASVTSAVVLAGCFPGRSAQLASGDPDISRVQNEDSSAACIRRHRSASGSRRIRTGPRSLLDCVCYFRVPLTNTIPFAAPIATAVDIDVHIDRLCHLHNPRYQPFLNHLHAGTTDGRKIKPAPIGADLNPLRAEINPLIMKCICPGVPRAPPESRAISRFPISQGGLIPLPVRQSAHTAALSASLIRIILSIFDICRHPLHELPRMFLTLESSDSRLDRAE